MLQAGIGMLRAKFVVLVAIALLFAQLQCAAACAAHLCGADSDKRSSLPPCHRHHAPSRDRTPDSCPHQTAAPAVSTEALHVEIRPVPAPGLPATISAALPADRWSSELAVSVFFPPGLRDLSSTLLRI